jgi:hypothetical protein
MLRHLGACKAPWKTCGQRARTRTRTRYENNVQPTGVVETSNSNAHHTEPFFAHSATEQDDSGEDNSLPSRQRTGIKKSTAAAYEVRPGPPTVRALLSIWRSRYLISRL